jgi:thioredoxin-related protein
MRPRILVLTATIAAGLVLAAAATDGIDWHDGDLQAAFDRAGAENKPLFLYWGAVWCPPCNQIKKTIFTRPEFIEKTRLFVPVYLDGDTESAQVWADKLGVSGYPSMLVLSPEGHEVMRMPTGLHVEEFVRVLDEALGRMIPISDILETAVSAPDPGDIPDRSFRLLAYHSWQQDPQVDLASRETEARLRALAERVPPRLAEERSRLYVQWLESAATLAATQPQAGEKRFRLAKRQRREADGRLHEILSSPQLTTANLEFLSYASAEVVRLIHPKKGRARDALVSRWLTAMRRAEEDDSLSIRERLYSLLPAIELAQLGNPDAAATDSELQARVRARAAWADETAEDAYSRQAAVGTAGYLLRRAGLNDEAKRLYLAEVEKSESPFYFMSYLADIAEEEGEASEAVTWLAKAYETSEGRATRFQWGTDYLLGLMDLLPDDNARIRSESLRVFTEMMALDDAFAGRNHVRVGRLSDKFREWNAEQAHVADVAALRAELLPACAGLSDSAPEGEESLRARCSDFFENLGAE